MRAHDLSGYRGLKECSDLMQIGCSANERPHDTLSLEKHHSNTPTRALNCTSHVTRTYSFNCNNHSFKDAVLAWIFKKTLSFVVYYIHNIRFIINIRR